jgi:hypothetical protein
LDDVAARLRKQLEACDGMVHRCFARAVDPKEHFETRDEMVSLAARMVQVSASLAIALKRLEGSQQNIVVTRAPAA